MIWVAANPTVKHSSARAGPVWRTERYRFGIEMPIWLLHAVETDRGAENVQTHLHERCCRAGKLRRHDCRGRSTETGRRSGREACSGKTGACCQTGRACGETGGNRPSRSRAAYGYTSQTGCAGTARRSGRASQPRTREFCAPKRSAARSRSALFPPQPGTPRGRITPFTVATQCVTTRHRALRRALGDESGHGVSPRPWSGAIVPAGTAGAAARAALHRP